MTENKLSLYDVVILGSGPAGLTAAIYSCRAHLTTLVMAGQPPGGQLALTSEVENFPGFPQGILGPELIQKMRSQAERFGAQTINENVVRVEFKTHPFKLWTEDKTEYQSLSVIIATGAHAKWLGLESEHRLRGRGVSACATCDGFFFKDKVVAVVGGGDGAMEEALFLTRFAQQVYVIHRRKVLRASQIMQERAKGHPKIRFIFNSEIKEVLGTKRVSGVKIINNQTHETSQLLIDGLFIAIGHQPSTQFLEGQIKLDKGYVVVNDQTRTSVEGVFAAGDVADYQYRQAVTAAGFGCMAALDAEKYISSLKHRPDE